MGLLYAEEWFHQWSLSKRALDSSILTTGFCFGMSIELRVMLDFLDSSGGGFCPFLKGSWNVESIDVLYEYG